jgi:putative GTP pyrophosphokinase
MLYLNIHQHNNVLKLRGYKMDLELMELEQFLERNNITSESWGSSKIEWSVLKEIGCDHYSKLEQLEESAELFAKIIQRGKKVHSVRYRVKDPEHLMEKIVRKTTPKDLNEAYLNICKDNYHEIITDLVGIRALHLFKDDCFEINEYLLNIFNNKEQPIYYYRDGDELRSDLDIFSAKVHPAGYRSIHYIFESQPLNQKIYTEVQVRTIFEEAWSEIDHKVRYPNFSENEQVSYFLRIFNRLAGSADEMGSFVKELVHELDLNAKELQEVKFENQRVNNENEKNIEEINNLFDQLDSSNGEYETQVELIKDLKSQVAKLTLKSKPVSRGIFVTKREEGSRTSFNFNNVIMDIAEAKELKPRTVKKKTPRKTVKNT